VGEYSALVASDVLAFEEGLQLVQARGQLMQRASSDIPGGMLAVLGVDDAVIDEACASVAPLVVCAANYNAPGQTIVSGEERGLEAVSEALKARGAKRIVRLNVSAAFHSPVMKAPAAQLQTAIEKAEIRRARWPVLANASAKPLTEPEDIRAELAHQIASPVRWEQSVRHMLAAGVTRLLEVGPGKVLTGLAKRIDPSVEGIALSDRAAIDAFNDAA
jgi:[acyl-carrier-protein] S-malonyltransferase